MSEREQMGCREFSKGSPGVDLMARSRKLRNLVSGPQRSLQHQAPAVMEETESFFLPSVDISRQPWRGPGKVTARLQTVSHPGFLGGRDRDSQVFSCMSDRIVLGQQV